MSHTLDARTDSTFYRGGTGEERGSKVTADDKGRIWDGGPAGRERSR